MASPYAVRLQFYLEGSETALFHELEGTEYRIEEGDVIHINGDTYKVESIELFLYDNQYINPETESEEWAMIAELYKVYLSVI